MKTNPIFLITTALLCSGASLTANDNLCGGADDDQIFGAPSLCGGADDDQIFGAPSLCGGADDDQFFLRLSQGISGDPLGVVAGPAGMVKQGISSDPLGVVAGPAAIVKQGISSDPLGLLAPPQTAGAVNPAQPPVVKGLVTDPLGLAPPLPLAPPPPGPNTNNVMAFWNILVGPAPAGNSGGNGSNSLKPVPMTDATLLRLLSTGSFMGDTMDDDDIFSGGGTDDIDAGDGTDF